MQSKSNNHNPDHWKVAQEREVYAYKPWMQIYMQDVNLPDGRLIQNFGRIKLQDYVCVFAQTSDGLVIVERQYKHGVGFVSLSLPAGGIEPGEQPVQAAQRELMEETGYSCDKWKSLGSFVSNGNYGCGTANFFLAQNATKVAEPNSGDLEEMKILLLPVDELITAIGNGQIGTTGTVAAISLGIMGLSGAIHHSS